MKRTFIRRVVLLAQLLTCTLWLAAQSRVIPAGGLDRFQDSLLQHHDSLRLLLNKELPVIAAYEFKLNRKGIIQDIRLKDHFSLGKKADMILRGALKTQKWNHLTRKERKSLCTVILWFRPETHAGDSANKPDSTLISRNDNKADDEENNLDLEDQEARYPGGEQAFISLIVKQFNFPDECRKKKHEGYVKMRFSIRPDGSISQILTMEESAGCPAFKKSMEEFIKISEPWIPAIKDGVLVSAWRELPVRISFE